MTIKRIVGKETKQYTISEYQDYLHTAPQSRQDAMIGELVIDVGNPDNPGLYIANISGNLLPAGGGGNFSSNNAAVMPYFISNTQSYIVQQNLQGLFSYPITIEGELNVDGILIEVPGGNGTLVEVNSDITAAVNTNYIVNTDTLAITITLPPAPNPGDQVGIIDGTGNASVNNITVTGNLHKIAGVIGDFIMNTDRRALQFIYYNTAQGWVLTEN